MVVVEGVARSLDPSLNMWTAAEPIAKEWVEANYGMVGRLKEAGEGAETLGKVFAEVPRVLAQAESTFDTRQESALALRWPAIDLQAQRLWLEATVIDGLGLWLFGSTGSHCHLAGCTGGLVRVGRRGGNWGNGLQLSNSAVPNENSVSLVFGRPAA
jgi:hypothetical protein